MFHVELFSSSIYLEGILKNYKDLFKIMGDMINQLLENLEILLKAEADLAFNEEAISLWKLWVLNE